MSCRKAQEVLDANDVQVETYSDTRKEKLDTRATWELVKNARSLHVAKGKQIEHLTPGRDSQDQILEAILGRTGTLRAPTVQIGDDYFVGFNAELYARVVAAAPSSAD